MAKVRFSDSSKSTILRQSIISGKIYVASDTHELYCDTLDGERIKISDIEYLETNDEREDILAPLNKFYYVSDTNKLWYYNERWVQIGPGSQLVIKANGTQLGSYTGEEAIEVNITKASIGLGNVPNVATNDQTPTFTPNSILTTLTSGEKLSVLLGKIAKAVSDLISHLANKSNPHGVTKSQVSLGNVTNDRQIKGLASGTTAGHVVTFGDDGYTVEDSGFTIGKSVPSNAVFTDTNTWIAFKGATASAAGTAGYVPAPSAGYNTRFFRGDGTWQVISLSTFGVTATAAELNILDGATITVTELNYLDGVTSNIQTQLNGKAATSHGTHVTYSTTAPLAPGTASAGSAATVARSDHRHPLQTTVSGNAGTATKLQTARTINGVSFDGSKNITIGVDDGVIS